MLKTRTMTFHAAHNYGSVLQAYALQQTIKEMGFENQIIDFRTERQMDLYSVFTKRVGIMYFLKNMAKLFFYTNLKQKGREFENFIREYLETTPCTYKTLEELEKADFEDVACFIAGSDQIFNPIPLDFDWAYYLPFVKNEKKVCYAPSFGPLSSFGESVVTEKIQNHLSSFRAVTVRDTAAADKLYSIGIEADVVLDPTLLLNDKAWESLISPNPVYPGEYIFFYTLFADKEMIKMVKLLSKRLNLPVVVSNFSNQYDVCNGFEKQYSSGPKEFLNLIFNAKFVITSSFHGTAFSTIFHKEFLAIRGGDDARISSLLNSIGLLGQTVQSTEDIITKQLAPIQYEKVDLRLQTLVADSKNKLKKMIVEV